MLRKRKSRKTKIGCKGRPSPVTGSAALQPLKFHKTKYYKECNSESAFLAEIRNSEACGRLIFAFFTNADSNKNENGNKIRKHLEYLL